LFELFDKKKKKKEMDQRKKIVVVWLKKEKEKVVGFFVYFCSFERGRKVCLPKYNMELV
jgi:hypothetical protein